MKAIIFADFTMAIPSRPVKNASVGQKLRNIPRNLLNGLETAEKFVRKIPELPKLQLLKLTGKIACGISAVGFLILYGFKGGIKDMLFVEGRVREAKFLEKHGIRAVSSESNPGTEKPFKSSYGLDFREKFDTKSDAES